MFSRVFDIAGHRLAIEVSDVLPETAAIDSPSRERLVSVTAESSNIDTMIRLEAGMELWCQDYLGRFVQDDAERQGRSQLGYSVTATGSSVTCRTNVEGRLILSGVSSLEQALADALRWGVSGEEEGTLCS